MTDPTLYIQWGGLALVVLAFAAAFVVPRILRAVRQRGEPAARSVEPVAETRMCPCGAVATSPLPRHKVIEIPILGRRVVRQQDPFGEPVVCDAHADVARTVIDERIAMAQLADASAARERITALANAGDVISVVAGTLPEAQRKAWERRPKALPRKVDEGEGG